MKGHSLKKITTNFLPITAGTLTAVIIIIIFQFQSSGPFPVPEERNPALFYELAQKARPGLIGNEFAGIILGIFTGSFLAAFISRSKGLVNALLVPVILLVLITSRYWGFTLQKELLLLALPCWIIVALAGFYLSCLIKLKRRKRSAQRFK